MQSVPVFVIRYRRETMCKGIISGDSAGALRSTHRKDAESPGLVGQVKKELALASATLACWLTQDEKVPGRRYC